MTHETKIIESSNVPKPGSHNLDPATAEYERLPDGGLLPIRLDAETAPVHAMGESKLLAELRIGHLTDQNEAEGHEFMVVKVGNTDDIDYRNLVTWAAQYGVPKSEFVIFAITRQGDQFSITDAAFLNMTGNNVLGREGDLHWNHYSGSAKMGQAPTESPFHDDLNVSRQQVRIGLFGDNHLLLENLSENSDTDVRTLLPH